MTERDLQDALIKRLSQECVWKYACSDPETITRLSAAGVEVHTDHPVLDRNFEEVLVEPLVADALKRLNPLI